MKQLLSIIPLILLILPASSCSQTAGGRPQAMEDRYLPDGDGVRVEAWIKDLRIPWSLVFLPDGRALVSERSGSIRLIKDGKLRPKPYASIAVAHTGEAGLMGLAIHPDFPKQPYVYAMHTYQKEDGSLANRVIRLKDNGETSALDKVVIDGIPGARLHDGGRIAFGPDRMLYITTGENFEADMAQDLGILGGKILRIAPDGGIPPDTPFEGSPIWSFGHRNPQGIAWQPGTGKLFESEHGPSGEFGRFGHDEINMIVKGGNYGWPKVIGAGGRQGYIDPIAVWKTATPPSGMTFYKGALLGHLRGDLFVATLRSRALLRIRLDGQRVTAVERWFASEGGDSRYGRLRDVVEGPDGALYFLTNNTDGRGTPAPGDDRIYRIIPN